MIGCKGTLKQAPQPLTHHSIVGHIIVSERKDYHYKESKELPPQDGVV